jgi:hypothetical protein
MPSSEVCATVLATTHNVSSTPLQQAATTIQSIHQACTAVTTKVRRIQELCDGFFGAAMAVTMFQQPAVDTGNPVLLHVCVSFFTMPLRG